MSAKGVLLGGVVDIVATNLLLIPVAIVAFAGMHGSLSTAQKTSAFAEALSNDPRFYLLALVLGSIASVIGGWTAARMARKSPELNGALSSYACIAFGLYGIGSPRDIAPLWQHIVIFALSPILGAAGGRIWARQEQRRPVVDVSHTIAPDAAEPAVEPLRGSTRAIAIANRVLFFGTATLACLLALVAVISMLQHQSTLLIGAVVVGGFCAGSAIMAELAAGRLRTNRRHWRLHVGSFVLLLVPIALMVVPILMARTP